MKQRLQEALKNCPADYADIRFETLDSTMFLFRGQEQDSASTRKSANGIVRACIHGGWGIVTFDNLEELPEKLAQACHFARLVGHETTCLAEAPVCTEDFPAAMKEDFRGHSLDEKVAMLQKYNDILLHAAPNISSTQSRYAERFRTVYYASTRGACFMEERPFIGLLLAAIGSKGNLVQRAFKSMGSPDDFGMVFGKESEAEEAARRASALLDAPKCEGGRTTVILDPNFTGLFTHEAFGHMSEADFLYENPKMRELMSVGRRLGPDILNIVDDGSLNGYMGSLRVDDEGTPTKRNMLIQNGVLAGHLHSLETAGKMGEAPTGNARAIAGNFPSIVRMTNTFIEPGNSTKEEMFRGVEDGIYACGGLAGMTQMEMFTFTASHGYRIRHGEICELLRDVMVTGNLFETLANIDAIGNDFMMENNSGGCGKNGQSPLPVGDGGPHIRIRNAVVAGDR